MIVISDNCFCASCLKKYSCRDYKMIVGIESMASKYLSFGNKAVKVLIQTEYCPYKEVRGDD